MMEYLYLPFMQRGIVLGIMLGIVTGIISVYVVLRKMSFVGVGISHSLFGAVALAYFLNLPIQVSIVLFSIVIGLFIFEIHKKISVDTSIGIIFSFSMAIGIILIKFTPGYGVDLMGFLFGSIISISRYNFIFAVTVSILLFILLMIFRKEFIYIAFDHELSKVYGVKYGFMDRLFFVIVSIAIAIGIKVMGIILISTILVVPGAFALLFTDDYRKAMVIAVVMNLLSIVGGIILSIPPNSPTGATIIVLEVFVFFVAFLFKKLMDTT